MHNAAYSKTIARREETLINWHPCIEIIKEILHKTKRSASEALHGRKPKMQPNPYFKAALQA
jgi:hypothetical protein